MVRHGGRPAYAQHRRQSQHTTVKAILKSHYPRTYAPTLSLYHRKERTFEHTKRREALAQGGPRAYHRGDNTRPGGPIPTLKKLDCGAITGGKFGRRLMTEALLQSRPVERRL
jgi:hypothetical protein